MSVLLVQRDTDPRSIGSTSDSLTGGEYFPPSSESEAEDRYNRARSASQPSSFRRHNLTLTLPVAQQPVFSDSPTSAIQNNGPFSDSYSAPLQQQEYFYVPNGNYAEPPSVPSQGIPQQYGYRLPASQPSSPVRSGYPPGQAPYEFQAGRQRGATFSGTFAPFGESFIPNFQVQVPVQPVSAVPAHLAYSNLPSPHTSPLAPSPVIGSPAIDSYFGEATYQAPNNSGLGMGEVMMEDVSTPTPALPLAPSRRSSFKKEPDVEMVEKLTLLDK